jgi:quercetin dioxygenase-like cupin family protein
MRVTTFTVSGEDVNASTEEHPGWQPYEEYDGQPLEDVRLVEISQVREAEFQLVEIKAGGSFVMHTSPDVAFCQIIRGRGKLGLPGDREVEYQGPELYIFHPGSYHDWHDIEEDTLLSVCLVKQG